MSNEQIIAELGWTKKVIKDITGLTPNTFRPPYGDIECVALLFSACTRGVLILCLSDRVRAILKAMDLTPIMWSSYNGKLFDT